MTKEQTTIDSAQILDRAPTLCALLEHIASTDHLYLWEKLPRLVELASDVRTSPIGNHPFAMEVLDLFYQLHSTLEAHSRKEDDIVFPLIRELLGANSVLATQGAALAEYLKELEYEHRQLRGILESLDRVSHHYHPESHAPSSFTSLLYALCALHVELLKHMDEEDHLLLPCLARLEKA